MSASYEEHEDELARPREPDRPHYAFGTLLGPEDFYLEQTYHRGRLAQALAALYGSGTIVGLKVGVDAADPSKDRPDDELTVSPGLALDRFGRLIELPRRYCIRLGRWFKQQCRDVPGEVAAAYHPASQAVLIDVFIRFVPCERGRTPVFATSTFDGLGAVAASRIRDGCEIVAFPRPSAAELPLPRQSAWLQEFDSGGDPDARRKILHEALLDAGHDFGANFDEQRGMLKPLAEHLDKQDTSFEFLARVSYPALNGDPPARDAARPVPPPVNDIRRFVYPPSAIARWAGMPAPPANE